MSTDVVIRAVSTDDTTQTCAPAFTGTRTVNFWKDYMSSTSGTRAASGNATPVASVATGTAIDLNFANNEEAKVTINYPDTGQMNMHARHENGRAAGRERGGTSG